MRLGRRIFGIFCVVAGIWLFIYGISGILDFGFVISLGNKYGPESRDTIGALLFIVIGILLFFKGIELLDPKKDDWQ